MREPTSSISIANVLCKLVRRSSRFVNSITRLARNSIYVLDRRARRYDSLSVLCQLIDTILV